MYVYRILILQEFPIRTENLGVKKLISLEEKCFISVGFSVKLYFVLRFVLWL